MKIYQILGHYLPRTNGSKAPEIFIQIKMKIHLEKKAETELVWHYLHFSRAVQLPVKNYYEIWNYVDNKHFSKIQTGLARICLEVSNQ